MTKSETPTSGLPDSAAPADAVRVRYLCSHHSAGADRARQIGEEEFVTEAAARNLGSYGIAEILPARGPVSRMPERVVLTRLEQLGDAIIHKRDNNAIAEAQRLWAQEGACARESIVRALQRLGIEHPNAEAE